MGHGDRIGTDQSEAAFKTIRDRIEPRPKNQMGPVTFLLALALMCGTLLGIVYILFG